MAFQEIAEKLSGYLLVRPASEKNASLNNGKILSGGEAEDNCTVMECRTPESAVELGSYLVIRRQQKDGSETFFPKSSGGCLPVFSSRATLKRFLDEYVKANGRLPRRILPDKPTRVSLVELMLGVHGSWKEIAVDPCYLKKTKIRELNGGTKSFHQMSSKELISLERLNKERSSDVPTAKSKFLPLLNADNPPPVAKDKNNGDGDGKEAIIKIGQPTGEFPVFGDDAKVLARAEQIGISPISFATD